MIPGIIFRRAIFVYQMPKTGSQSIAAALEQSGRAEPVLRFHFLSKEIAATIRKGLRYERANASWRRDARAQLALMRRVRLAIRARKVLAGCGARLPKLQVITGVREPVALAVSAMFENYAYAFPTGPEALTACREAVLKPKTLHYLQSWFDLELKRMLGLDVYQQPFSPARGFAIYENALARVLVFRFEALGRAREMLRDFCGLEAPAVPRQNAGATKPYAEAYRYVRERLRLPGEFLAQQYGSRMMRHFYTATERAQFLAQWCEAPGQARTVEEMAA